MTGAGDLDQRAAFDKQSATSDGAGGTTTAFAEQFTRWAGFKHLRGGEAVMAGRLAGKHSLIATVRRDSSTMLIGTDWRMRDVRTGEAFNIRDITPTKDRAFLELLCESGVAT